jgi:DNA segregation ATPase FtsK/SpoIIIE, S-DNA-T family
MAIQSQRRQGRVKKKKRASRTKKQDSVAHIQLAEHISREAYGIFFITLGIIFFLGLIGKAGPLGVTIDTVLASLFGVGKWMIPLMFLVLAGALFLARSLHFHLTRNIGILFLLSSILGLIHLQTPLYAMNVDVEQYGGWVGFSFSLLFRVFFSTENSDLAATIILLGCFLISVLITFEISFRDIWNYFHPQTSLEKVTKDTEPFADTENVADGEIRIVKPVTVDETTSIVKQLMPSTELLDIKRPQAKKDAARKKAIKKDGIVIKNIEVEGDWEFPSLDLLIDEVDDNYPADEVLHSQAQNIKEKLQEFGIQVEMVDARVGPTVTQFTVSPQEGVTVKKILHAKDDLALALAAKAIRIEAPIPGQPYVGIEIPNEKRSTVYMHELLESEEFTSIHSPLRLVLGKDVSGKAVIADLAKMPHLLIAGATGSGKSVGMNSFLVSLLYQNSPADLKFIMIDPKRVELTGYNGIPHLLTPVITEADKALAALKWAVAEMMRRYQDCSEKGYRNIEEFNEAEDKKMPKIVIVIDELADLMMRDLRKDTEAAIMRLAQMARAVGIHLIIATQRPSVDVITGVIKANIPTRISFTVTSAVDSRTILDSLGAEGLLGMGDMLFLNSQTPKPQRIQGIFLSSKEIERVTNHLKVTPEPEDLSDLTLDEEEEAANAVGIGIDLEAIKQASEEDALVPEAIQVIKDTGKASATLLQRMLSIGYARAAKILDILEKKGFIGPANGAKPRTIFIDQMEE